MIPTDDDSLPLDDAPLLPTEWSAELWFLGNGFTAEDCERLTGLRPLKAWKPKPTVKYSQDFPLSQCWYELDGRFELMEDAVTSALNIGEAHAEEIGGFVQRYSAELSLSVTLRAFEGAVPIELSPAILGRLATLGCALGISVPLEWSYSETETPPKPA